jgi:hypothetical protein
MRALGLAQTVRSGIRPPSPSERGEGAKQWLTTLAELRNHGIADVCIVGCYGRKGLPEAIGEIWPGQRAAVRGALLRARDYADARGSAGRLRRSGHGLSA